MIAGEQREPAQGLAEAGLASLSRAPGAARSGRERGRARARGRGARIPQQPAGGSPGDRREPARLESYPYPCLSPSAC